MVARRKEAPVEEQLAQSFKLISSRRSTYERYRDHATGHQSPVKMVRKDVSSTNAQYAHGPQGVFNTPGVNPNVYSTIVRPLGLASQLTFIASNEVTPLYEVITAMAADVGSEPGSECATPVRAGKLTAGFLTAPFGRVIRSTDTLAINALGQIVNSAEPLDLRIANPIVDSSPFIPDPAKIQDIMNTELGKQYWSLGLSFERKMEPMIFGGNVNTIIGSGRDYGYKEFAGLQTIVNTGSIDAVTGTLMPAVDSLLVNWSNALPTGTTTLNGQNTDIVTTISSMYNYLYSKAERMRMLPVDWRIVMRYDAFYALTAVWPCNYLTNQCTTSILNSATQFVSGAEQIEMRDDMREGLFLWIMGKRVPVIISDGINESAAGGATVSDIYFLPFSAAGSMVMYMNYFDYNNQQIDQSLNTLLGYQFTVTNGGLYMWTFQRDGYCAWLQAKCDPRLVLRTPHLAARLQNFGYQTPIHTIDGYSGSLYAAPGGGSTVGTYGSALYTYAV